MFQLNNLFSSINPNITAAVIGASASLFILLLRGFAKFLNDRYSLNYRLNKEFAFEQKKRIKEEISTNKMALLNAAEELNFRLWNLSSNIGHKWHNIPEPEWHNPKNYYLHSFVYRLLTFLSFIFRTDKLVLTYDSTLFSKNDNDIIYLKYIKSFKNYFSDVMMLKEFNYNPEYATNHFFRDHLADEVRFVSSDSNEIICYAEYLDKISKDYSQIHQTIKYITDIEQKSENINYNVIMGLHIMLIFFLNRYGHDYQKTIIPKINGIITDAYSKMANKTGFVEYLARCKIHKEFTHAIKLLIPDRSKRCNIVRDRYFGINAI